jgi:hypothetical protein
VDGGRVPWPFPGDSELDKARRIARDYRNELHRIAPEHCARMDEQARRLGQGWVTPQLATIDLDDWITVREAAEYLSLSESAIRKMINRSSAKLNAIVGDDGIQRVRVAQLVDIQREQRERRAGRRAAC